jgi:hypothetical protein
MIRVLCIPTFSKVGSICRKNRGILDFRPTKIAHLAKKRRENPAVIGGTRRFPSDSASDTSARPDLAWDAAGC